MLVLIVIFARIKSEGEQDDEDDSKKKIANRLRRAELIRVVVFVFIFPLSPRWATLKEQSWFNLREPAGFSASLPGGG